MKRCVTCGHVVEEEVKFCQKCGAQTFEADTPAETHKTTTRKGMKVAAIVCFVLALLYLIIAMAKMPMMIGGTVFCVVLGGMFLVLSKSPKNNDYILGKTTGMKKKPFVWGCVGIAYLLFGIIINIVGVPTENDKTAPPTVATQTKSQAVMSEEKATLAQVKEWYEKQMPNISRSLIQYADSVKGLSAMNVEQTKFRLGEDAGWYDCHYTVHFACKIDGERCIGESRAFLKYGEAEPKWFHFEIWRERDGKTMIEQYDESYDKIIEEYYKVLKEKHK